MASIPATPADGNTPVEVKMAGIFTSKDCASFLCSTSQENGCIFDTNIDLFLGHNHHG